ncbi:twin-arginine translocase subunit TatC [Streptococcus macacae]|uniref:Sec-independent protein translocase protein TatC n=1 Tax=Streptococcus macacae NCTC 11558 TaxID=764298 RepID=G5JVH5_9STRE|nr:twin-arginine translocase subunit TatC [Streptococcus macacae]EHJ51669.1 twin arginine-targeting protein translocase TatC [Streptococcus macacae NCTC 11558]SUN78570.1 Sec-independent protein translocase tatC [Streptococcus macacae NCTC 11558]
MDKKEETVIEHLQELRKRLIYLLAFFLLSFCLSFVWAPIIYRFLTSQFHQKLLVLGPNDILWIYISLANLSAISFTIPFASYQIWLYIKPALKKKEANLLLLYVPAVFLCFMAGLAFGFFLVTPSLLKVLLSLGDNLFKTQITAQNYISFVLYTSLPLAFVFELPVLVAFLTSLGLLSSGFLKKYRRYAYFILIVLAVILTPADLVSDLLMSVPLLLIYEMSIFLSSLIERKRGRKNGNS